MRDELRDVISGTLVPADFAAHELLDRVRVRVGEMTTRRVRRGLEALWRRSAAALGPATPVRAVAEIAAVPLLQVLGYRCDGVHVEHGRRLARARLDGARGLDASLIVVTWGEDLGAAWREAVRQGAALDARWCFCCNGTHVRLMDTRRSWARRFVEFRVQGCAASEDGAALLTGLAGPAALARRRDRAASTGAPVGTECFLDEVTEAAAQHASRVCSSLREGVRAVVTLLVREFGRCAARRSASGRGHQPPLEHQALAVVYRILFLLYAEARLLVPLWHPVYRASYSVEALRDDLERGADATGYWSTLQAISRVARSGCRWQRLVVTPFNGQLFAADAAPLAEHCRVDDRVAREVVRRLATAPAPGGGRRRISYGDLGVEQLGAVYEQLLDDVSGGDGEVVGPHRSRVPAGSGAGEPAPVGPDAVAAGAQKGRPVRALSVRKATGSFYTPRSITDFLVRRTLHPLVADRAPDDVLRLRVLDPAMGSGAFLVAACRYLATAYEQAVVARGDARPGDIGEADRAAFRRHVAQRCLYGVDLNPMAVQLARLSLWLATLAGDAPLTFLDHRLRVGDSLLGADPADLARQPPGRGRRRASAGALPLFEPADLAAAWRAAVPVRSRLATVPDDSIGVVKWKEQALRDMSQPGAPLGAWKRLADVWCALWFWDDPRTAPPGAAFAELCQVVRGGPSVLPAAVSEGWLREAGRIADRRRFFHWVLEFPEVFADEGGAARPDGGFDAVIGNPPWDMVRDDGGGASDGGQGSDPALLARFVRDAGLYTGAPGAHVNRYHLFVERAIHLLRVGGRLGLVVPWGLLSDHGSTALRQRLFARTCMESIVSFDNARGIFPIHRALRFVLLTATTGARTMEVACRFGERDPRVLDGLPDRGAALPQFPFRITRALLDRLSGPRLSVPDVRAPAELSLLTRLFSEFPALGAPHGWGLSFGRELNATDARPFLSRGGRGVSVLEGKHLSPFTADVAASDTVVGEEALSRLLGRDEGWRRPRVAYRDVSAPTNRFPLIAAVLPAGTVSSHTVHRLRTPLAEDEQWLLCALLNSLVLNWIARFWIGSHVTVALVERLPAAVPRGDVRVGTLARLARSMRGGIQKALDGYVTLQVRVAEAYGLTVEEWTLVVESFRLFDARLRVRLRESLERTTARPDGRAGVVPGVADVARHPSSGSAVRFSPPEPRAPT